jgi:PhzF family phenazine biosynthesis protein
MDKNVKIYQVDAFTKEKFKGNPAGVVINSDQLTDKEMQAIAREINNSETAFIFSPEDPQHFCKIRYFTPKIEVPFCGHATIASHHILATIHKKKNDQYIQESNIGDIPIEINRHDNFYHISLNQDQIEIGEIISQQTETDILKAIGLEKKDVIRNYPLQVISTGHSKVIIPISNQNILNDLKPDFYTLSKISRTIKCNGYFVVTMENQVNNKLITHGRMFAPIIGIDEDPVTGNANGPLGIYLVHNRIVTACDGVFEFEALQGEAMGRSGSMKVQVKVDNNQKPINIKITGTAVTVFETDMVF